MLTQPIPAVDPGMPASLRYIQNGDALNTGNHQAQAEDVANAVGHLEITKADKENGQHTGTATFVNLTASGTVALEGATTADDLEVTQAIKTDVGSITRVVQDIPRASSAVWDTTDPSNIFQASTSVGTINYALDIPHGATLTQVRLYLKGASGHTLLPEGAERASLVVGYSTMPSGGDDFGVEFDSSESTSEYQADHTIELTMNHVVDRTVNRYWAIVTGESGDNAVVGLSVSGLDCTFTPATYDPG